MAPEYVSCVLGRVFAVRWRAFTLQALSAVREEIARARRLSAQRLVYLSLIPESPRSFSEAERTILASFLRDLLASDCSSVHHVIEGSGFAASVRRSIVTSLAVAAERPEVCQTHATLRTALAAIAAETGDSPEKLFQEASRRKIPFR